MIALVLLLFAFLAPVPFGNFPQQSANCPIYPHLLQLPFIGLHSCKDGALARWLTIHRAENLSIPKAPKNTRLIKTPKSDDLTMETCSFSAHWIVCLFSALWVFGAMGSQHWAWCHPFLFDVCMFLFIWMLAKCSPFWILLQAPSSLFNLIQKRSTFALVACFSKNWI